MSLRIKVVTACTPNILGYAALSAATNRHYCGRHGYGFDHGILDRFALAPQQEKVRVVHRHLADANYVCWVDSDACVIDFSRRIEEFCSGDHDLVIAGHNYGFDLLGQRRRFRVGGRRAGLNTGVFLVRNSPWSWTMLGEWWRRCVHGHQCRSAFHEQGILQDMLLSDALDMQAHTDLVEPCSRLNRSDDDGRDECGFMLHLWGTGDDIRARVFGEIARGIRPDIGVDMPRFHVESCW